MALESEQVGHVGGEMVAPDAPESDRALTPTGLDVGGLLTSPLTVSFETPDASREGRVGRGVLLTRRG